MQYAELPPSPRLAPFVECFWWLHGHEPPGPERALDVAFDKVVPDGAPEIVLNRADPFRRLTDEGEVETHPRMVVVGQLDRFIQLATPAHCDVMGVRLRPAGLGALFGPVALELTHRVVDPADVAPEFARACAEILDAWGTPFERARSLERVLLHTIARRADGASHASRSNDSLVRRAAQHLVETSGRARISTLASDLGISARHLSRLFRPRVGLGPKQLARILRFQSVMAAAEAHPGASWVHTAIDAGYSDQAHLIHDARALAGDTPRCLIADAGDLTRFFTRSGAASVG